MTFAAFDIEIANTDIPDGFHRDLFDYGPLEYAIGAVLLDGDNEVEFYENPHQLLGRLIQLKRAGVRIVSCNGLRFDMRVLAYATDNKTMSVDLAWNHYDIIFQFFCLLGYPISLNTLGNGLGVGGKVIHCRKKNGDFVYVSSKDIPKLWFEGEKEVVKAYQAGDVGKTLLVAKSLEERKCFQWTSGSGRLKRQPIVRLDIAEECNKYREPYTGWMVDPMKREDFYAWTME